MEVLEAAWPLLPIFDECRGHQCLGTITVCLHQVRSDTKMILRAHLPLNFCKSAICLPTPVHPARALHPPGRLEPQSELLHRPLYQPRSGLWNEENIIDSHHCKTSLTQTRLGRTMTLSYQECNGSPSASTLSGTFRWHWPG